MTPSDFKYSTRYFLQEGKANLDWCLEAAFCAAVDHGIAKIVIFTGAGDGVVKAIERFRSRDEYEDIALIAVTFPNGSRFLTDSEPGISDTTKAFLTQNGTPVVRAHLPFESIQASHPTYGVLGQDSSLIGNALGIFSGSMGLCVQAALMACDAGEVQTGEHVICVSSDTAILVRATSTSAFLTDFVVREILCKPVRFDVSKGEMIPSEEAQEQAKTSLEENVAQPLLEANQSAEE